MTEKEPYKPTAEEVSKAEGMMTDKEREMSKQRVEQERRYQEQKIEAQEMIEAALEDMYDRNYGNPDAYTDERLARAAEEVQRKFPGLVVVKLKSWDVAIEDERRLHHVSGGSHEMAHTLDIVRNNIEIRTPMEEAREEHELEKGIVELKARIKESEESDKAEDGRWLSYAESDLHELETDLERLQKKEYLDPSN